MSRVVGHQMTPTWRELWQRLAWMCYHIYRDHRKNRQRHRIARLQAKRPPLRAYEQVSILKKSAAISDANAMRIMKQVYKDQYTAQGYPVRQVFQDEQGWTILPNFGKDAPH